MRALKILIVGLAAAVFAVGAVTIFKEVQVRVTHEAKVVVASGTALRVFGDDRVVARIISDSEQAQLLIQVFAANGSQVDLTCSRDRITTSHMVPREEVIYYYFDRDGDGLPEMRSKKDPRTRESVPEYLISARWEARNSTRE